MNSNALLKIVGFDSKYVISDNGCWNWLLTVNEHGYGKTRAKINGVWKTLGSHRVSWLIHKGEIPNGLFVLHKCDNRKCVNPDHLFLGTQQDNMDDCRNKGRKARLLGELNPDSRLTGSDVVEIKRLLQNKVPQRTIAKQFGVSQNMISHINLGKYWSHIKEN